MKGIIWCHWWRFFIAVHTAHQHCVVSVSCIIHLFSSGVQGQSPDRRPGGRSPLSIFKVHTMKLKARWNERHNLMTMMACFIAVHTSIVLFQCHVAQCLASWGAWPLAPPPLNPPLSCASARTRSNCRANEINLVCCQLEGDKSFPSDCNSEPRYHLTRSWHGRWFS